MLSLNTFWMISYSTSKALHQSCPSPLSKGPNLALAYIFLPPLSRGHICTWSPQLPSPQRTHHQLSLYRSSLISHPSSLRTPSHWDHLSHTTTVMPMLSKNTMHSQPYFVMTLLLPNAPKSEANGVTSFPVSSPSFFRSVIFLSDLRSRRKIYTPSSLYPIRRIFFINDFLKNIYLIKILYYAIKTNSISYHLLNIGLGILTNLCFELIKISNFDLNQVPNRFYLNCLRPSK